jgi:hypothetical protein
LTLDKHPLPQNRLSPKDVKDKLGQWFAEVAREIEEHPMNSPRAFGQFLHVTAPDFLKDLLASEVQRLAWVEDLVLTG